MIESSLTDRFFSSDFGSTGSVLMVLLPWRKVLTIILEKYVAECNKNFSINDHRQTDLLSLLKHGYTHVMYFQLWRELFFDRKIKLQEKNKK